MLLSSVNEQYYLADDAYNDLINSSNAAKNLYQIFLQKLFEKEAPVTKDMKTEADVLIKDIKSNYSGKEEELQNQLSQMGYRDLNSYKEGILNFYNTLLLLTNISLIILMKFLRIITTLPHQDM